MHLLREHRTAGASERELMAHRFDAAQALLASARVKPRFASVSDLPHPVPALEDGARPFPPTERLANLTPRRLHALLATEGCVKVPNLVPHPIVDQLVADVDRALDACDAWTADYERCAVLDECRTSEWFEPFRADEGGSVHLARPWARAGGAIYTGDSPRVANRWFQLIRDVGLFDLISHYYGEEPITTLDKCALRRIGGEETGIEWHQDGTFLGDTGAVDVWLCLSDTTRAPGLDIVSRRFDHLVETGTGSATYEWTVGPELVAELAEAAPIVQPAFAPGDALIFDELLLHRTSPPASALPDLRYGIETWFFRPSAFPEQQQVPLAI